jgi:aminoglycoside phosphotransferase (APT) family kinase protein
LSHVAIDIHSAFEELLYQIHDEHRLIRDIHEQPHGSQGASGSQVRYFNVTNTDPQGGVHQDHLVTKSASRLERRVLHLLSSQGCAVPPVVIPNMAGDERALVYMPYLEARPPLDLGHPESPLTHSIAEGLAGIHAANRNQPLAWLPHTSEDFLGRLWLHAWREQWHSNLEDPEFATEFGVHTSRLEAAMERFIRTLEALTAEGTTLTVLNVDLIPDHIRLWRGKACFIDWEQSSYGSLYLDLPNHFTVEIALVCRDALARHNYPIPEVEFLERYHEISRYMGLRYLGHALWQWAQDGEQRRQGRWFLYYTFSLALFGR